MGGILSVDGIFDSAYLCHRAELATHLIGQERLCSGRSGCGDAIVLYLTAVILDDSKEMRLSPDKILSAVSSNAGKCLVLV
jgi:hypothetical protein